MTIKANTEGTTETPTQAVSEAPAQAPETAARKMVPEFVRSLIDQALPTGEEAEPATQEPADPTETPEAPVPSSEEDADPTSLEAQPNEPEAGERVSHKGMQKRIDKLTARNSELQERLAELEAKITEQAETPKAEAKATPASANPLDRIEDEQELNNVSNTARKVIRSIERYQANAMRGAELSEFESYLREQGVWDQDADTADAAALNELKFNAQDIMDVHIPERREYLQRESAVTPFVKEQFPELFDPKSERYATAQQILEAQPEIRKSPHWRIMVGTYILGLEALQARMKGQAQPKAAAPVKPAPRVAGAPVAAVTARPSSQNGGDVSKVLLGSRDDKVEWVKSRLPSLTR